MTAKTLKISKQAAFSSAVFLASVVMTPGSWAQKSTTAETVRFGAAATSNTSNSFSGTTYAPPQRFSSSPNTAPADNAGSVNSIVDQAAASQPSSKHNGDLSGLNNGVKHELQNSSLGNKAGPKFTNGYTAGSQFKSGYSAGTQFSNGFSSTPQLDQHPVRALNY